MMGVVARLSRWHGVFAAALQKRPAVGFHVALLEHLGRHVDRTTSGWGLIGRD